MNVLMEMLRALDPKNPQVINSFIFCVVFFLFVRLDIVHCFIPPVLQIGLRTMLVPQLIALFHFGHRTFFIPN